MLYKCGGHGDPRVTKFVRLNSPPGSAANSVLIEWCQTLTVSSRQRAARTFLARLQTFITSGINYVQGIAEVKEEDCKALCNLWKSQLEEEEEDDETDAFDPFSWLRQDAWNEDMNGTFCAKKSQTAKVNILGEPIGIIPRLTKVLLLCSRLICLLTIRALSPGL